MLNRPRTLGRSTQTQPARRATTRPEPITLAGVPEAPGSDDLGSGQAIVDLADRHSDGLDVVLMWGRHSGQLWVEVTHRNSGRTARIDAEPHDALDVFHHPFAYAVDLR